jgi:hypothetical protein
MFRFEAGIMAERMITIGLEAGNSILDSRNRVESRIVSRDS